MPAIRDEQLHRYCLTEYGRAMVEEYMGMVEHAVRSARCTRESLGDDLAQSACCGLIDAVAHFRPDIGVEFATYAPPRIRGEVRDFLRCRRFMTPHRDGRGAHAGERPRLHSIHRGSSSPARDEEWSSGGDGHFAVPDHAPPPGSEMRSAEAFEAWLRGLSEAEKTIVRVYYGPDPETLEQIGLRIGEPKYKVRRMHESVLDRLRYRATFARYRELATA